MSTLILSVAALDLLVYTFLHLLLQYPSPGRFVVAGDLENVGGIDPVV